MKSGITLSLLLFSSALFAKELSDTSEYVIFKNGEWVSSKLDIHPSPITGYKNFYQTILEALKYPEKGYKNNVEGKVFITFEVDTIGSTSNYIIFSGIGASCDSSVIATLQTIDSKWVPAKLEGRKYPAKFAMSFEFRLVNYKPPIEKAQLKMEDLKSKFIKNIIVHDRDQLIFTLVDQSAEPVGGVTSFYKWVKKNIKQNKDCSGKNVFVSFVIEHNGSITNGQVTKGINPQCDQEALRIISIAPNWKPGRQSGRTVRQGYTIPIGF